MDSNSCGVASVGPQLSVSETGEARNIRPGGANNRTSGSALLTGGARYAPPNAGPAVTSREAKMPQWGIFRARLANPPAPNKKDPQLRLRVFFCAGAGRIRTGRPPAGGKKQPCGLFFRPRLANLPAPTKKYDARA